MKNTSVNRQNTGTVAMLWRGGNWVTGRWQDGWRERKVAKQRIVAKMSGNDPPHGGGGGGQREPKEYLRGLGRVAGVSGPHSRKCEFQRLACNAESRDKGRASQLPE